MCLIVIMILHGATLSIEFCCEEWVRYHLNLECHFLRQNAGNPGNMLETQVSNL